MFQGILKLKIILFFTIFNPDYTLELRNEALRYNKYNDFIGFCIA